MLVPTGGNWPHVIDVLSILIGHIHERLFLFTAQQAADCTDCIGNQGQVNDVQKKLLAAFFIVSLFGQLGNVMGKMFKPFILMVNSDQYKSFVKSGSGMVWDAS